VNEGDPLRNRDAAKNLRI